jgi:hypothetical protein
MFARSLVKSSLWGLSVAREKGEKLHDAYEKEHQSLRVRNKDTTPTLDVRL